jgi:gamma-glutamylcyclotransferase (GGCT)/AIG2-like uncharacterized protein YtfP
VFVYGTLKRGFDNHVRLCRGVARVEAATVRGRLYEFPFGFPALVVPEEDILARGTTDYSADAEMQHDARAVAPATPGEGWDTVRGELLTFGDPETRLPALDALEGFRPGETSLYSRVLLPIRAPGGETTPAWTYAMPGARGAYLPDGRWPAR